MEVTRVSFEKEMGRVRSVFKPGAEEIAEKSVTLEKRGSIAIIWFDQFQEKANKLSSPNMLRLFRLFGEIEKDKQVGCLVLLSKKPTIFIAGADIGEIEKLTSSGSPDLAKDLMLLQNIPTYLESLPIPSIAAIHGACMGGGTELSLACDYRVASDAAETKIGLPEVLLGVIPGWGGTQRLPRLIGLEKSLDMILTGRAVDGKKAKKLGLVDRVFPKEFLEEQTLLWAEQIAKSRKKRRVSELGLREKLIETVPGGKWLIFDQARKKVLEKTKGHYPAPLAALDVIRSTYGGSLEKGLAKEAEVFAKLVTTFEAQNLIKVFYLSERVKKNKGPSTTATTHEIKNTAVIGAGVMGGGIAQLFASKGLARVRMKDVNWDAITKGYQAAYKVFKEEKEKKKIKQHDLENAISRIEGTTTYDGFRGVDLVVEAVVEDLEIKKKVFDELAKKVSEKALLCTNTSSLSITALAEGIPNPGRVVGMHFFNPVHKMPLVEIVRGKKSSEEAITTVFQFAKKLGKTPILVKDSPGFLINRILGPYLNEALYLLLEGASARRVDTVMEKFGMPMGPCTLLDEVGLDVTSKVSKILYGAFGERMKPPSVFENIAADGRLGKKNRKGIYLYDNNGKRTTEDPTLLSKGVLKRPSTPVTDETIQNRLIYLMVNEAARCLEEQIITDPADLDIGMIYGTGFAPFRGGLLNYADSIGAEAIVSDLEVFARNYGPRYEPSNYLQQQAVKKGKFYVEL